MTEVDYPVVSEWKRGEGKPRSNGTAFFVLVSLAPIIDGYYEIVCPAPSDKPQEWAATVMNNDGTNRRGLSMTCESLTDAKSMCEEDYREQLTKTMDYGEAMKTVVCGHRVQSSELVDGCYYFIDSVGRIRIHSETGGDYNATISAGDVGATYTLYFPAKRKRVRQDASIKQVERWTCPNPECQVHYDYDLLNAPGEMECDHCDTLMRRPS